MTTPQIPLFSPGTPKETIADQLNAGVRDPLTFLLKRPIFRARRTTALALVENTHKFIPWNQIDEDNFSGWSSGQPTQYVAPVSGYYLICNQVSLTNAAAGAASLVLISAISRNGAPPYGVGSPGWEGLETRIATTNPSPKSVNSVMEVYANAGDFLELDLWYSTESAITGVDTTIGWQCAIEIVWTSI